MKIKIKEGFLLRKVAGDHVVVPVGEADRKSTRLNSSH